MKSTFSVIFYLKRQAVKKDGTVPVMGRITADGTQTQFSSKLSVDPKLWDTNGGRVTGRSSAALVTNRLLDKMRVSINRHYQEIMERDNFVTAEKVKDAFLGLEHRCHTLMQVFRQHNEDYAKQVEAGMKAKATLSKYLVVYKLLQEFLNIRYHVKDIALKELTPAFISDFEMFLRTDKHCRFPIKVVSERTLKEGLEFIDNRFVIEGKYKYTYNNGHLAMADTHAAATNFLNALERTPDIIDQYKEKIATLEREIPQLQEIAGKTWKKEDELKKLKSELAALDRKIQLELAPPMPESTEEYRQGSEKKQTEQQTESPHVDFARSHLVIGRPGLTEPKGMKL